MHLEVSGVSRADHMKVVPAQHYLDSHGWSVGDLVFDWRDLLGLIIGIEHHEVVDAPEHAIGYAINLRVLLADGTVTVWHADSVCRMQKLATD